jgi:hypothetical protein
LEKPVTPLSLTGRAALIDFANRLLALDVPHADVAHVAQIADQTIRHLTGKAREQTGALQELEREWYASLAAGKPAFDVYERTEYLGDLWACWALYSRKYVNNLAGLPGIRVGVNVVADVGCGLGYSTAALRAAFPGATVFGTNLPGTIQTAFAERLGVELGFDVVPALDRPVDLLFASEYFEHFQEPVAHLRDLLRAEPSVVVTASTFNAASIGHFPAYLIDGETLDGPATSRRFNNELRSSGYAKIETGFWNNRPAVWRQTNA